MVRILTKRKAYYGIRSPKISEAILHLFQKYIVKRDPFPQFHTNKVEYFSGRCIFIINTSYLNININYAVTNWTPTEAEN